MSQTRVISLILPLNLTDSPVNKSLDSFVLHNKARQFLAAFHLSEHLLLVRVATYDTLQDFICVYVAVLIQFEVGTFLLLCLVHVDHLGPRVTLEQSSGVAHNEQEVTRSRDGHIQATHICQEAQTSLQRSERV